MSQLTRGKKREKKLDQNDGTLLSASPAPPGGCRGPPPGGPGPARPGRQHAHGCGPRRGVYEGEREGEVFLPLLFLKVFFRRDRSISRRWSSDFGAPRRPAGASFLRSLSMPADFLTGLLPSATFSRRKKASRGAEKRRGNRASAVVVDDGNLGGNGSRGRRRRKRCAFLRRSPALIEFGHALKSTTDM